MLQTDSRVGDYEIYELLHNSRKELFYRVRNIVANRWEAMKVLPDALQQDLDARERFLREIKVLARLLHPNIVTFYHATELDGRAVMTMELLEGISLAERMERGPLSLQESIRIIQPVLTALAYAHAQGVIHREVTPDNIWLLNDNKVKLGGFGLAKAKGDMRLTREGTSLGEVHYMSPEQIKGVGAIDQRADIYSAACVLYQMLTGKRPFEAKSEFDVMLAHVQRFPAPVTVVNPNVPGAVHAVMEKALAKEPADRYSTAVGFLEEAVAALTGMTPAVPALAHAAPVRSEPLKPIAVAPLPPMRPIHVVAMPPPATSVFGEDRLLTGLVVATLIVTLLWVATFFVQ
ncbi:MAG: serine/threonine protein kinase [Acidobacteria bacterium]|nr:serine/threonine protein kinase [Acidobacteriota bacterium]